MSSSICWIQSIVSKLISILNKRINLTMMKWSKNLYQNKFTILAALRSLILSNKMMDIRDKTSWPRKDQTPPSKKTVIREAVQPNCIIRVAENFQTWSRILITTSRSLIKTSWTHKLIIQTKSRKLNKKSQSKWITTATMISHNSITTQTTSWTSILRTRKIWIWEVICQIMQSTCSSMRKNHMLMSHRSTRNIINIRKSIMDIHQEVTPSKLETIILMEGTNIRPVTTSSRAPMAADHLKIISHISRARLTPITADQEKLHKIT